MRNYLQELINYITKRVDDELAEYGTHAQLTQDHQGVIDDGVTYNPHEDTRPDFVKRDEYGWELLTRLDKR